MKRNREIEAALVKFQPGAAVRLSDHVLHPEFRGLPGRVVRTVKSRGVVTVACCNGEKYDAFPENVELLEESASHS